MTTRYEAFLPEVLPYVPECPEQVAINAVRNACIEFCEKSQYWLYDHDPINGVAHMSTYELDLPTCTTAARVMDAWYNNIPLTPRGEDEIKRTYPFDWRELEGNPVFFVQQTQNEVILVPKPLISASQALKLIVVLKPTRDSVDIDDEIYELWAEAIGYGARARLHGLPNQPFSDPLAAVKYTGMFETAIGRAKVARNRGLARATQRVRPPRLV